MQQPPRTRRRTFPQWFRAQTRFSKVGLGCGVLIVSGLICFVSLAVYGSTLPKPAQQAQAPTATTIPTQSVPTPTVTTAIASTQPTTSPTPTNTPLPTAIPTAKPTSTPSGIPATFGRPVLGGPVSDFVGKFGQPNDHSIPGASYHFLRVPGQAQDDLIIGISPDNQKVDDITVATSDPGWTLSDAQLQCLAYAPLDYHFEQKIPYADNTGFDMIYTSASLAKAFPASDFTDASGNTVAAGTFDISYLYGSDTQHIGDCDMIYGSQQTNG